MIEKCDKPKGFEHLPNHYKWYGLFYKGNVYCYVGVEIIGPWAAYHIEIKKWTHNIKKQLSLDWNELKQMARNEGATTAIASNDYKDLKWCKFIKMFGFPEPKQVLISKQEI